jgi:hypothetical protein
MAGADSKPVVEFPDGRGGKVTGGLGVILHLRHQAQAGGHWWVYPCCAGVADFSELVVSLPS